MWSSDEGDVCCGIKYFWNPRGKKFTMLLTRTEKVNVLAAALWSTRLSNDVETIAEDQLAELEKMGYTLFKKRKKT